MVEKGKIYIFYWIKVKKVNLEVLYTSLFSKKNHVDRLNRTNTFIYFLFTCHKIRTTCCTSLEI